MYGCFTVNTYIYHKKSTIHVGKYTSPMDGMGICTSMFLPGKKSCISPWKTQPGGVKSDASEQVLSTAWAEPRRPVFFWGDTLMRWSCP